MPLALVNEFEGVTGTDHAAVSGYPGIDPEPGEGDWPPGMLWHEAGSAGNGTFMVSQVWSGREPPTSLGPTYLGLHRLKGQVVRPLAGRLLAVFCCVCRATRTC